MLSQYVQQINRNVEELISEELTRKDTCQYSKQIIDTIESLKADLNHLNEVIDISLVVESSKDDESNEVVSMNLSNLTHCLQLVKECLVSYRVQVDTTFVLLSYYIKVRRV